MVLLISLINSSLNGIMKPDCFVPIVLCFLQEVHVFSMETNSWMWFKVAMDLALIWE